MAENFPAGRIYEENWWINSSNGEVSPCSLGINSDFGWMNDMVNLKSRSTCKDYSHNGNTLQCNNNTISLAYGDHQKPQQLGDSESGDGSILMDSTLQMIGFNFSSSCSSSSDWKQALIQSGNTSGENYNPMLQEETNLGVVNTSSSEIQMDWSTDPKSTFTGTVTGGEEDPFNAINQDFSLHQQSLNPLNNSENNPTATCQDLSSSEFLMGASTYHYPSSLVQSLFEAGPPQQQQQQQQQSSFNNRPMNYYGTNSLSTEPSPPCWPYNELPSSDSNGTPFWNVSAPSLDDIVVPTLEEKPNENNHVVRKIENLGSVVNGCEPVFKRPRIETPSPLPTFKVRKEKLGDRITALQQLVSPFGKTDTASVLHEAIEYIKFLHDQVNALSTPYMKNDTTIQLQQTAKRLNGSGGSIVDLRSRGLCLVPMSNTVPIANESTSAFWTPTFGATLR